MPDANSALIRVAIADDHKLYRKGIRAILNDFPQLEVVMEAANGRELLDLIPQYIPDVVLMDLRMPELDGIKATRQIKETFPRIKIIILSMYDDERFIEHLIEAGANGYLLKNAEATDVEEAICSVCAKGYFINKQVSEKLLNKIKRFTSPSILELTDREGELLRLLSQDMSYREVAQQLRIDIAEVEGSVSDLLERAGTRHVYGLMMYAIRNNLIGLE